MLRRRRQLNAKLHAQDEQSKLRPRQFMAITLFDHLIEAWLRTFPALPYGILSYGTLGRIFARLDATRFEAGFRDGVQTHRLHWY